MGTVSKSSASGIGARLAAAAVVLAAALALPGPAQAVPPGQNGAIVFQTGTALPTCCDDGDAVYLMGPNGEEPGPLVPSAAFPIPHPSGKAVAVSTGGGQELWDANGNYVRDIFPSIQDFTADGRRGVLVRNGELSILDLETNEVTGLGVVANPLAGEQISQARFTPNGNKIVYVFRDLPSFGVSRTRIFTVNTNGSGATPIFEGFVGGGLSVSPNGTRVAFGGADDIWIMGIDGSDPHPITESAAGFYYVAPAFSPDGSKIVAEKRIPAGDDAIVVMDTAGGGEFELINESDIPGPGVLWNPRWLAAPSTLKMTLEARRVNDGDDIFDVVMRLRAGNQSAVENLTFTDPQIIASSAAGFPEEQRSRVSKVAGPNGPIPHRLEINEERTLVWTYKIEKPGRVALFSEVSARAESDGVEETDGHTVVADSIPKEGPDTDGEITPELAAMGAMDNWLVEAYEAWMDGNEAEARRLVRWAKNQLSAKERKVWLGAKNKLKVSPAEHAFADRANISPELAGAMIPDAQKAKKLGLVNRERVPTDREIAAAFFRGYKNEIVRQGKRDIGKGWNKVKNGFLSGVAIFNYLNGDASPEERAQVEAMAMNTWTLAADKADIDYDSAEGKQVLARYGHSMYKDHVGVPVTPIRAEDVESIWNDITLQTDDLQAQLKQEKIKLKNIYKNNSIVKAAEKHGAMTGDESYPWVKLGAETMVGAGVERLAGKAVTSAPGLVRLGKSTGQVSPKGKPVKNPKVELAHDQIGSTGARPSVRDVVISRRNFDGETLDELESVGGIPLREAEIQREIIADIESELGLAEGQIGLALKPSSPLRKENSVAKFELAKVKTGKPIHERLGMDPAALSEPTFFKPKDPKKLPEWDQLSSLEQDDLIKTYEKARKEYKDWTSGKPKDPDLAKLSKATQRTDGPKIKKPVTIDIGQGREVRAIFEEVPVPGTNTIRIRVKYYEVDGIVFLDSKKARPMGPDLDAVAIYDAKNGARFTDRQLETQILRAYRKKVADRVRGGERFHGAEHGMTLIMDDVSAGPKGSVGFLMQYGIPYLPEPAAYKFARRIEPFVEMLAEEIMSNVGKQNSGAFGQELVNVTSRDVYYGKLPLEAW